MSIQVQNISKSFGNFRALNDVSLHVPDGELVALLGPSGSGKTTLLRIIAGLEFPNPGSGAVLFHDEDVSGQAVGQRGVGFVFQHYALFRHMSVFENVAFGLKVRPWRTRPRKAEIRRRVMELLQLVQLDSMAARLPSQLSGGQRQRVALARALAVEPKVLLLDEPFGALDAQVRRELRRWLRKLHDEVHITSVFVTHDQEEALEVADRIAVMNKGQIEQLGTPEEVYEHPANPFVYNFLGNVNLFHGRVDEGRLKIGDGEMELPGDPPTATDRTDRTNGTGRTGSTGGRSEPQIPAPVANGTNAIAYVRPHDVEIRRDGNGDSILARIDHISTAGPFVQVQLTRRDNQQAIEAALTRERYKELGLKPAEDVFVKLNNARVFSDDYSI